ncbi:MAG: prepilin-type N-terminal cleavage/methylation domain-containing protein, partial [Campylobacter sp.]|nr:prepilin-type N-terminal cleavage/methylation domain-containing protein [Campylobacter sp.]MBP3207912.1 prepilin-type N-terminal cleavage/methylation domain-containing protein [Campylobacter sp.]
MKKGFTMIELIFVI